jgi:hypothetical protein
LKTIFIFDCEYDVRNHYGKHKRKSVYIYPIHLRILLRNFQFIALRLISNTYSKAAAWKIHTAGIAGARPTVHLL